MGMFYKKNAAPLRRSSSWTFDEKILVQALYKVLLSVSKKYPVVLYIRDVEKFLHKSPKMYLLEIFQGNKISDKDIMKLEATDDALKVYSINFLLVDVIL